MRTSPADPVEFPELPIGRLGHQTMQRVMAAVEIHHRAGPWAPCTEDFARVLRIVERPRPGAEPVVRPGGAIEVAVYA